MTEPTPREDCQHDHTTCDECGMGFTAMTPPITRREPLDVQVLAEALWTAEDQPTGYAQYADPVEARKFAQRIAAEYARLEAER